ncbi:MAG: TolC family protein [Proteobacteria bacterium]|nr:TolC family protein [Pseudomonadota bacterium]
MRKLILILALLTSCNIEPKYVKPEADVPFKSLENPYKKKITQISWQEFFKSPDLQKIIQLALENNKDLKTAALNVEIAEGTHGVARSNLLPAISGTAYETRQGVPSAFSGFTPKKQFRANVGFTSYEVDFLGRLRSLKKSALEDFLASKEAQNIAKITVISQTANAYAQFLLDSQLLEIAAENVSTQNDRYQLTTIRYQQNIDSNTTLLAAENLLETAKINFETYKKLVAQDKSALMALVGAFDEKSIPQDKTIDDIKIAEDLLDFIPSENLLLRPDVKQAEHDLKSANANIGAARAAFFPYITLSGTYGYASRELNTLFNNNTWTFTPQINIPIFSGGRNVANLDVANARKNLKINQYEKVVQTAFREALDQLAEREETTNQLSSYEKILSARENSYKISEKKNQVGLLSKINILDAKISLLEARKNQLNAKKQSITNLIALYKIMGGGAEIE